MITTFHGVCFKTYFATFTFMQIFASMPNEAAIRYGDRKFQGMMMAKIYCVHMISQLGYNQLFQDVDVVWYRNPLEWFLDKKNPAFGFDMYFQDDGAHSVRYAPYSPNTGFYFVRANVRTQYFFNNFLKSADAIMQSGSHQSALTAVMNEHVSYRGLRVKILARDQDDFPGGFHFHRNKKFMKEMIQGKSTPVRVFRCYFFSQRIMTIDLCSLSNLPFSHNVFGQSISSTCLGHKIRKTSESSFNKWGIGMSTRSVLGEVSRQSLQRVLLGIWHQLVVLQCHWSNAISVTSLVRFHAWTAPILTKGDPRFGKLYTYSVCKWQS